MRLSSARGRTALPPRSRSRAQACRSLSMRRSRQLAEVAAPTPSRCRASSTTSARRYTPWGSPRHSSDRCRSAITGSSGSNRRPCWFIHSTTTCLRQWSGDRLRTPRSAWVPTLRDISVSSERSPLHGRSSRMWCSRLPGSRAIPSQPRVSVCVHCSRPGAWHRVTSPPSVRAPCLGESQHTASSRSRRSRRVQSAWFWAPLRTSSDGRSREAARRNSPIHSRRISALSAGRFSSAHRSTRLKSFLPHRQSCAICRLVRCSASRAASCRTGTSRNLNVIDTARGRSRSIGRLMRRCRGAMRRFAPRRPFTLAVP